MKFSAKKMGEEEEEEFFPTVPFDRTVEQAILAMKKGAHLLKCGRRGKPKFCPFRLSSDEKYLIWYSDREEQELRLSLVSKIVSGQRTVNFQRQLQPDREHQSFSLIYANGEQSLDLICKDKAQANCWLIGLKAVISRCHHSRTFPHPRNHAGAHSCVNSPAGYFRRRYNLGIPEDCTEISQVHSVCGSPTLSLSDRCFSDGFSLSSDSFGLSESSLLHMNNVADVLIPNSPCVEHSKLKKNGYVFNGPDSQKVPSHRFVSPTCGSPQVEKNDVLKDILIWGEGVEGGSIGSMIHGSANRNYLQVDALVPRLLESTAMLDVGSLSLGGKHAALVTKQGEVFCWGDGSWGKLGHKVNMDVSYPKVVECLDGVNVKSVTCGEYQTCALSHSGELYMWGDNKCATDLEVEERTRSRWLPHQVFGLSDSITVSKVACGEWHTAFVSSSGQLFTFGDGTFGVLGHGNLQSISQPKEVEYLKGFRTKSVACGTWHTAAVVDISIDCFKFNSLSGKLFTWGDGDKGRLGHADVGKKLLPTRVARVVDYDFVQVSCGRMLTVALTNTGKVYTMGSSVHGQLGNPMAKDKSITIVEGNLKQEFVREISSGSYHIAVLTSAGNVYTWGKGEQGQLGLGDTEDRNLPTYVEALKDRKIESIACGSNLTAVICLHRSISIVDQATCNGCRMSFGFSRKKHNCYNCGLQFCRTCSGKKVVNASLAPDKSKPSRVCNSCFNNLQKITCSGSSVGTGTYGLRQVLLSQKMSSDQAEDKVNTLTPRGHLLSTTSLSAMESQLGERIILRSQEEKQQLLETMSSFSARLPQWGQVPCPLVFRSYDKEHVVDPLHSKSLVSSVVNQKEVVSDSDGKDVVDPLNSKSLILSVVNENEVMSDSENMLTEVQRLRAEVRGLEMQCEARSQMIQAYQKSTEETWLVARAEAAKRKAANDIVKALTLKLHTMFEKASSGKEDKNGDGQNVAEKAHACSHISTSMSNTPAFALTHLPPKVKLPQRRELDPLSSSPIVFSCSLKSKDHRELTHEPSQVANASHSSQEDSRQTGAKASTHEWVEQYEAGVYITFTTLPGGKRGLKRVRFSRRRFAEEEAEGWWEQNQVMVYQKYGIEGYTNSTQNQRKI